MHAVLYPTINSDNCMVLPWCVKLNFSFRTSFFCVPTVNFYEIQQDATGHTGRRMSIIDASILRFCSTSEYTIYTRKTQNCIILTTRTYLVRGDGVVVLGAGGLGGHATTTSAGRAVRQLDLVGGQRRSDQLSWPGTQVLASVLARMRL